MVLLSRVQYAVNTTKHLNGFICKLECLLYILAHASFTLHFTGGKKFAFYRRITKRPIPLIIPQIPELLTAFKTFKLPSKVCVLKLSKSSRWCDYCRYYELSINDV